MDEVLLLSTVLAPILAGIVELIKRSVSVSKKALPAVGVVTGIVLGIVAYPFTDLDLTLRIWAGGFAGLAGAGLFDLIKPMTKAEK